LFTGIIEHLGTIDALQLNGDGGRVTIHAPGLGPRLAISNSVAVNGCCLTIVSVDKEHFSADLSGETLHKTSFGAGGGQLKPGARVNLEQPLTAGEELGGHFVLGHVDGIGYVKYLEAEGHDGHSWRFGVQVPEKFARYIVPKGSLAVDGISLTVSRWEKGIAETAVIPYTYHQTNLRDRKVGDAVNLEGDVLGKYFERYLQARGAEARSSAITVEKLIAEGF